MNEYVINLRTEARSNQPRRGETDSIIARLGSQSRGKLEHKKGLENIIYYVFLNKTIDTCCKKRGRKKKFECRNVYTAVMPMMAL